MLIPETASDFFIESDNESWSKEEDEEDPDEIPGELESPICRVMIVEILSKMMTDNAIDLEPSYQRGMVWSKSTQSSLIDSIFKNKWIQAVLFSERIVHVKTKDKDGQSRVDSRKAKRILVCMDGKERLNSINLFLSGKIPWIRRAEKQWYFKQSDPPDPFRLIISEKLQEVFLNRKITTVWHQKLTEVQERDIFRSVQEGKPLTIGEKMQAASGPWADFLEELTQTYMIRDEKYPNGWSSRIVRKSRGTEFKTMTAMVLLIRDMISQPNTSPRPLTSGQLQKELIALQKIPVSSNLQFEIRKLLDLFMKISLLAPPNTPYTPELTTPEAIFAPIKDGRKSMISPVEMVWIPYLINRHREKLSLGKMLELIELFKVDIRIKYPGEIKNTKEVACFIINWIMTIDLRRLDGKYREFKVPQKLKIRGAKPSGPLAATPPPFKLKNINGAPPTDPQSDKQSKRKTGVENDSVPISSSKRPRTSVPHPSSNLAQSTTAKSPLDPTIASNSAPGTSKGSLGTKPTANSNSEGKNVKGIDKAAGTKATQSSGKFAVRGSAGTLVGQSASSTKSFTKQFVWRGKHS